MPFKDPKKQAECHARWRERNKEILRLRWCLWSRRRRAKAQRERNRPQG